VNGVVVTVRVEVPDPPGLRVTDVGFSVAAIVGVLGTTVEERETVPEKPLLFRVIWEVPKLPVGMFRVEGLALIEKSGATTNIPNMVVGWMVQ
jgi:hypothetical protein